MVYYEHPRTKKFDKFYVNSIEVDYKRTANRWATVVGTTTWSVETSHLLPTKTRGKSWSSTCLSHSLIHVGRFSNEAKLVTSYT